MTSYRYVAYDIINDLKQVYDDSQITLASVVYWMHIIGDKYRRIRVDKYDAYQFLNRIPNVSASTGYITIPQIYDRNYDRGIEYVEGTWVGFSGSFARTTPSARYRLSKSPEEVPSISNPYFYVEGHKVMLLGVPTTASVTIGLYTSFNVSNPINLDDEFEFPQDMLPLLKQELLQMGRVVLSSPDNAVNDGSANATPPQQPTPTQYKSTIVDNETQQQ